MGSEVSALDEVEDVGAWGGGKYGLLGGAIQGSMEAQ